MSHDLRIVNNSFRRNGQIGIHIENSTKQPRSRATSSWAMATSGSSSQADGNQVRGNRCVRNGTGILRRPRQPECDRRQPHSGRRRGDRDREGSGQRSRPQRGLTYAIRHPPRDRRPTDREHRHARSRKSGHTAGKDGFRVAERHRNAALRGNIARRSGDDGFDINSPSARLQHNRALGSAGDRDSNGSKDARREPRHDVSGCSAPRALAVSAAFLIHSTVSGTWAPRLPAIKESLGLSDGELGTALVGLAIGLVVGTRVAGAPVDRFGSRPVMRVGFPLLAARWCCRGWRTASSPCCSRCSCWGWRAGRSTWP